MLDSSEENSNKESVKSDLICLDDVKLLVDSFYAKVRQDGVLGIIFSKVIDGRWPQHLDKMYRFWQTVLLQEHTYFGSPFPPHAHLPVDSEHFERWKSLFFETIDENFEGEKAAEAKWRANKMAEMFLMKINHIKNNKTQHIV